MHRRFVSIWFRYLSTDWFTRRRPGLAALPFVLAAPDHGRMVITAVNPKAEALGINMGMPVADARAVMGSLEVLDDDPALSARLLQALAAWCIRYTPIVSVDPPAGLLLDATGCAHLWGGETAYITGIHKRFSDFGYHTNIAMADTIGAAYAIARFAAESTIIKSGMQVTALLQVPVGALRIEPQTEERLHKLGLRQVKHIANISPTALRRRFGQPLLQRLQQALGGEEEMLLPVIPEEPYREWLPCLEPIVTATGINIALETLLDKLCRRLRKEGKGLRTAVLKAYRIDGKTEQAAIGTHLPTHNAQHIFKLFEYKLPGIEPALGIELFILEAPKVEAVITVQEALWKIKGVQDSMQLAELLDRITGKIGTGCIHRYLPDAHYWPERSYKEAASLTEQPVTQWQAYRPRPIHILSHPEPIQVTAPIPDYPPMLFRYKGAVHNIKKADGPERIEQEWWLQEGQHRDYYCVEDEAGRRYWLFRLGHYGAEEPAQWFLHGFFA